MEMPGIEPGAFHMQSERATTALHPLFDKHMLSLIQSPIHPTLFTVEINKNKKKGLHQTFF